MVKLLPFIFLCCLLACLQGTSDAGNVLSGIEYGSAADGLTEDIDDDAGAELMDVDQIANRGINTASRFTDLTDVDQVANRGKNTVSRFTDNTFRRFGGGGGSGRRLGGRPHASSARSAKRGSRAQRTSNAGNMFTEQVVDNTGDDIRNVGEVADKGINTVPGLTDIRNVGEVADKGINSVSRFTDVQNSVKAADKKLSYLSNYVKNSVRRNLCVRFCTIYDGSD